MRTALAKRFTATPLMVLLTACYSWQPATVSPRQVIPDGQRSPVRVTLTTDEILTIKAPAIRNDSIVGTTDVDGTSRTFAVAVAARDVRLLEVQRLQVVKTLGLVLGTATVAAVVYLAHALDSASR